VTQTEWPSIPSVNRNPLVRSFKGRQITVPHNQGDAGAIEGVIGPALTATTHLTTQPFADVSGNNAIDPIAESNK